VIPEKLDEGNDTYGLLHYLYGPGRRDEHVDPHMVAAWDSYIDDPARSPNMTISDLALMMDAPVYALLGKKPPLHVYHVAVRNAPEDRILTDAEWARVARDLMDAAGIAPHDSDQGCRWVAIRHADDHIHIVATKAREDGRQPNLRQDIVKMHQVADRYEREFGLHRVQRGDKTARKWAKSGETEKAVRRGLKEPARETLQRTVREAAAAAVSDTDFFARLSAAGLRVQQRIAPDGNMTGYSVALPGDRNRTQQPVWFSGSRLAPDLSLPRVRERWQGAVLRTNAEPAGVWRVAEEKVRLAAYQLGTGGLHQGAGDVAALGDLIVVAAVVSPRVVRDQLRQAAYEFERASRAPIARRLEGQARGLYRESTQVLTQSAVSVGSGDASAALGFLLALVLAVDAALRWHQAQQHRAQGEAAGRAGRLLREAVEVTAGAGAARDYRPRPKRTSARAGSPRRAAAAAGERSMAGVVQEALPEHARTVLADAAWPTLRKQLVEIERAGEDPVDVLATVAVRRELGSADSITDVLSWRLDGWRRQSSSTAVAPGTKTPTRSTGGGPPGPVRKKGASAPARRPPGDEQDKGPTRAR
jgi:hypothetical protein